MAAAVFCYYEKYYNDYGDIIKITLRNCKKINKVSCARTMAVSLSMLFRDLHRGPDNQIDRESEEFLSLKVSQSTTIVTKIILIILLIRSFERQELILSFTLVVVFRN